jgi:hypothetical protein
MEALGSSESSVLTRYTRSHIPEGGILHSHRRANLKSYTVLFLTNILNLLLFKGCGLHKYSELLNFGICKSFLKDPTNQVSSSLHLLTETGPSSETLCYLAFRITDGQRAKPQFYTP